MRDVLPAGGMVDWSNRATRQNFIGGAFAEIAGKADVFARKRSERPAKRTEGFAGDGYVLGRVTKQVRAHPIHCRGISGGEQESHRQRLGREWPIALAGDDRVGDMYHATLHLIGHGAVGFAEQAPHFRLFTAAGDMVAWSDTRSLYCCVAGETVTVVVVTAAVTVYVALPSLGSSPSAPL